MITAMSLCPSRRSPLPGAGHPRARKVAVSLGLLAVVLTLAARSIITHGYVTTPSMYPTIPPGSLVLVRPEPSYHVGQVIEFRRNGLDFVHRIIAIDPRGDITTKGDNPRNAPDAFVPPTTSADVIGVVYAAPRFLGFPSLIAHHPYVGLAWLRTELGTRGELAVSLVVGLLVLLMTAGRRPEAGARASVGRQGESSATRPKTEPQDD